MFSNKSWALSSKYSRQRFRFSAYFLGGARPAIFSRSNKAKAMSIGASSALPGFFTPRFCNFWAKSALRLRPMPFICAAPTEAMRACSAMLNTALASGLSGANLLCMVSLCKAWVSANMSALPRINVISSALEIKLGSGSRAFWPLTLGRSTP